MTSLKIGLVDLDTSHPGSFVPIVREMGHHVTGVFDSGTIYPPGYASTFAREHGIAHACETIEELVERVDAVFIHSCDWDLHVQHARPFIEAGKAVFIDKPLAGNARDLQQLIDWGKDGSILTGGSALRYCNEVKEWRERGIGTEEWVYGLVGCAVDEFNYGIHAYSMLHGLMGAGIESARYVGETTQQQFELAWKDGRRAMVSIGKTSGYLPFYASITTQKQVEFIKADNNRLYQAILENVLPYMAGEAPSPISLDELAEAEMAAIAAKMSAERDGALIRIQDIPLSEVGYNGGLFAQQYKAMKFPVSR
ncbi:hypothetical protein PAT3040_01011 [Paenibacillus agaridevorans]|uniref:Gfo/Idh/MocA-like oxidoreductase N-terminal domain-containing protein n=1 Tax=Paenibacillus agaridevorans TaxID=171404 RepID=A0A2R5ESW1_9BACL|nr:Gfo/Idh/MocA family oxidoreductase [Paenibacillus agaridevorans]GBG06484.1 hypothetical protein PAT3040_01011 [Paenibacillus agaridevorans]